MSASKRKRIAGVSLMSAVKRQKSRKRRTRMIVSVRSRKPNVSRMSAISVSSWMASAARMKPVSNAKTQVLSVR